jgi:hypothetical protein
MIYLNFIYKGDVVNVVECNVEDTPLIRDVIINLVCSGGMDRPENYDRFVITSEPMNGWVG